MTREAADVLVEKYRILRQDDATGAGRNSYRITVRQLESMIRLSEAIARANCTSEITPAFVREAYSLLRQSIIHVEHDAIDFDEEELEGERENDRPHNVDNEDVQMVGDRTMADAADETSIPVRVNIPGRQVPPGPTGSSRSDSLIPATEPAPRPKKRMVITHDKYMALQSMVVHYLSEHEHKTGKGLDREELIDWYLEQREEEMQDVDELEYEKELIVKLLRRLVRENYLLEIKGNVQASMLSMDEDSQESSAAVDGQNLRVYYMVHPSVDTESSLTSGY